MINTNIQKLILYNERVLAHFDGTAILSESDLLDCFVLSSKLLQDVSTDALNFKFELEREQVTTKAVKEVNKMMVKTLALSKGNTDNDLLNLHFLSKLAAKNEQENIMIRRDNAQLRAEIELIKDKQQKQF